MNLSSKKFLRIILAAVAFSGGLLFNNTALARSDGSNLTVEVWDNSSSSWVSFNSQSLFSEENFLPGQDAARHIRVANETAEEQKIGIKFADTSGIQCDENCLSDKLDISIYESGNNNLLCDGTLTNFYENGETYLSDIGAGKNVEYNLSVKFTSAAGNDYQESAVKFDIEIGFFGEESIGAEIPSGGSEGIIIAGVVISDERVTVGETQAIVEWTTSYNSTSRVIYSPQGFPHLFNLNYPPNYGYVYSSIEEDNVFPISENGTINHSVVLSNLSSGTTYYYRAISHASPPSITEERSFTTLGSTSSNGKKSGGKSSHKHYRKNKKLAGNILASSLNLSNGESGETNNETSVADSLSPSSEIGGTEKENGEVAGEHGRDCKGQSWWIWALALIVYAILFNFNNFFGEQKRERIRWFWEALYTIVALSLWNMFDQCHINIWFPCLIIIIGLSSYGYYLWGMKKALR
ncbi:fibronectin type III domain-containing protein [bacterium]|nr:fibronectin type III domain-containing protein [bacterium]